MAHGPLWCIPGTQGPARSDRDGGDLARDPDRAAVDLNLREERRLGTASPWCADVPAKASGKPPTTIKNDRLDRFLGQPNTAPPIECPIYGSASGAFLTLAVGHCLSPLRAAEIDALDATPRARSRQARMLGF